MKSGDIDEDSAVYLERLQKLEAEMSVISKKMHSTQTVVPRRNSKPQHPFYLIIKNSKIK
jgi:hypothetical protein